MEYKSKYNTKSLSIYGEPKYNLVNRIDKYIIGIEKNVLIPNSQDGTYALPFANKEYRVTCYEENSALLNGGDIDDFTSLGLINRLKGAKLENSIDVKKYIFYSKKCQNKYNLVLAIRTLQLKENDSFYLEYKINSLMECVKDKGYLYIVYYLNDDIEISENQRLQKGDMLKFIDLEKWNIIYYRENADRITFHDKHPFHKAKHNHYVGTILLQKTPYIYKKRKCDRIKKKGSIYGECNQQVYDYISFLKKQYERNIDVLVVDANDGKNVIPIARKGLNVTCYECDDALLNGGTINGMKTDGLKKRVYVYSISDFVNIVEKNYYEFKEIKKYDFIYVENSLSLQRNKNITINKKIRKLILNVREGGYLYIYYDLSDDNNDCNLYLKNGEMKKYFDLEDWKIVYICERNKINYSHYSKNDRKVGYILAQKMRNRRIHKCTFKIELNTDFII